MILAIILVFTVGYILIATEHTIGIDKSASALLTGTLCWTLYIIFSGIPANEILDSLSHHTSDIAGILFFLLSAMTIVELIDAHNGFDVITSKITTRNRTKLLWITCILAFFLSAIIDNLTTAIVMVTLLRKLINDREERWLYTGMIVIAANAGGAWSPLGDVTTTMLWIGGQISAINIMQKLFLPSLVCLAVPLVLASFKLKGNLEDIKESVSSNYTTTGERYLVFILGLSSLLFVPAFKILTGLPPYIGILLALSVLWITIQIIHRKKINNEKEEFTVANALQRIDTPSILFFLGILLAVAALDASDILHQFALLLDQQIGDTNQIIISIGIVSAIIDNVPLVAASMGMYDLSLYPMDDYLWEFLAYCAGTGGSMLIIGSAAGVACMGMEKITFMWYLKKIGWLAAAGYLAGAFLYIYLN
jgi:Na+/H+ antiporter NhaD/arsenite permease-like protein